MKKLIALTALLALPFALFAGEGKEVSLEGTGLCAKCSLKQTESCTNALQVTKKDGSIATYIFTENMKHGAHFCKGKTEGLTVTGVVTKKDGKLMLKPTAVEKKDS